MKKKILWGPIVLLIFTISIVMLFIILRYVKVKNIFDELYCAEVDRFYTSARFGNVGAISHIGAHDSWPSSIVDSYSRNYLDEHLNNRESIGIVVNRIDKTLSVYYLLTYGKTDQKLLSDDDIEVRFTYYKDEKKLIYDNIEVAINEGRLTTDADSVNEFMDKYDLSRENIYDFLNYMLYQKLLTDWFEGNPSSRFSMENLGKFTVEDNLFQLLDESLQEE